MRARATILLLGAVAVGLAATPLGAQSLADVARKEQERRQALKEHGKVITNQNLPDTPVPTITSPASDTPSAPAPTDSAKTGAGGESSKTAGKDATNKDAEGKDTAGKDAKPKDQKYWSERMKALRDALSRDEIGVEAMQSRINALTTDFINRDDPAQRSVIDQNRQKASAELTRLTQAVVDDKKAIADLEEEARRAGVPSGWLRQ